MFERRLPEVYLLCALLVTVTLSVLTPPFFTPDEPSHFLRAVQISHGRLIAQPGPGGAGDMVDRKVMSCIIVAIEAEGDLIARYPRARDRPNGRISWSQMHAMQAYSPGHDAIFAPFPNTAVYGPLLYLPQAAAWRMAEALRLSVVHGLVLVRAAAATVAILLGWWALRHCPTRRELLFITLLLPTVLNLNASSSQDALSLSVGAVFFVLLGRALCEERWLRPLELCTVSILLVAWIGARVAYLPLAVLVFLPLLNGVHFSVRPFLRTASSFAAVVLCVALWQTETARLGLVQGNGADAAAQRAFLLAHPVGGVAILLRSVLVSAPVMTLRSLEVLGVNDVAPSVAARAAFLLTVVVCTLLSSSRCRLRWQARLLTACLLLAAMCAVSLALYLIWTPPAGASVQGLQSRYFIPLFPLMTLLLPGLPLVRAPLGLALGRGLRLGLDGGLRLGSGLGVRRAMQCAACLVVAATALSLPWVVARGFYNCGPAAALRHLAGF